MPNITNFTSRYQNLARMNRFKVSGFGLDQELEFLAKGATLPSTSVPVLEVNYQGRIVKYDGDRVYEPFEITMYGDEEMKARRLFEEWNLECNGSESNAGTLVKREGLITLLNRQGDEQMGFQLHGCLCSTVSSVALDWGTNDTPMEFTVTIDYDYHDIV